MFDKKLLLAAAWAAASEAVQATIPKRPKRTPASRSEADIGSFHPGQRTAEAGRRMQRDLAARYGHRQARRMTRRAYKLRDGFVDSRGGELA